MLRKRLGIKAPTRSSTPSLISIPSPTNPPKNDSNCGFSSCTDTILGSYADGYSCGSRIEWLQTAAGYNEFDSCRKVSEEFPDICTCTCDEESDYVMFNNGKGGGICSPNTAIIKDEYLDAALEVGGGMPNLFRSVLNAGTWNFTPCGCFIWNDKYIDYMDPAEGNCRVRDQVNFICTSSTIFVRNLRGNMSN